MPLVTIPAGAHDLDGELVVPPGALGLVAFAHGSGSSRKSPRNRYVAAALQAAGLGTLLFDLLTGAEARLDEVAGELRFDIPLLAHRLTAAVDWLGAEFDEPIGLFGASTGAAAALVTAAARPTLVRAVVSRGGRPDLAGSALARVSAPTLLLVGARDPVVIDLNRRAMRAMRGPVDLSIIDGASHLFEEPGTMDAVVDQAAAFLCAHLGGVHGEGGRR